MITVVDYDAGNVGSVINICRKAGGQAQSASDPAAIVAASKLILPGVGHFGGAMARLKQSGIAEALQEAVVRRKAPILGICLGMQLFSDHSEEGDADGLGWIDAKTVRFRFDPGSTLKVPHMGWNAATPARPDPLTEGLPQDSRFYFVHAYHLVCADESDVLCRTNHGGAFTSAVRRDNVWGVQFHPEKSHRFGLAMIRNFVERVAPC